MPSSTANKAPGFAKKSQTATKGQKTEDKKKFCVECFGRHPDHKNHCSWSAGSKAANTNIVSPDDNNKNDTVTRIAGGYKGKIRASKDPWGLKTVAKNTPKNDKHDAEDSEKVVDNDFVMVEGEWVEI